MTFVGQSVTFFYEQPLMPYMQRWQWGVQRELPGGYVAEATYVGNRGTHVEINQNLNVTPQQYLSTSPVRDNPAINYLSANLPNPFLGLLPAGAIGAFTAANIGRERLLRPYPHFDGVNATRYDGYSWYHAMQLKLEKRFSRGYTVMANYTFSKFMQASEVLNQDDPRPLEVISDQDRPHRLAVSGIYEIPIGRGRRYLSTMHPVAGAIFGGWQIAGIYTYQSGPPINFGNIIFAGNINDVPLPGGQRTVNAWFNTGAGFERNAALQLDRNLRMFPLRFGFLRGDSVNNFDFGAIKNARITESKTLQFRADFLNALNRAQFPNPNTNPAQVAFGTVVASTQENYARRIQLGLRFVF